MEINLMIIDLKRKVEATKLDTIRAEQVAVKLRDQLEATEAVIKENKDSMEAMKMAIDALELLSAPALRPSGEPEKDAEPESKPVQEPKQAVAPEKSIHHSRKPKAIIKCNAKGERIGYYPSVNACAKALGWTSTGVSKLIQSVSVERQIKLKGFSLRYAA